MPAISTTDRFLIISTALALLLLFVVYSIFKRLFKKKPKRKNKTEIKQVKALIKSLQTEKNGYYKTIKGLVKNYKKYGGFVYETGWEILVRLDKKSYQENKEIVNVYENIRGTDLLTYESIRFLSGGGLEVNI